jgi:hypothetical protein
MSEEKYQDKSEKKKKPVVKKVVGNVKPSEVTEMKTPGKPSYEHG